MKKPVALALGLFFVLAYANAHAGPLLSQGDPFMSLQNQLVSVLDGPLFQALGLLMLVMGLGLSIVKQSPMPALSGVMTAGLISFGPTLLTTLINPAATTVAEPAAVVAVSTPPVLKAPAVAKPAAQSAPAIVRQANGEPALAPLGTDTTTTSAPSHDVAKPKATVVATGPSFADSVVKSAKSTVDSAKGFHLSQGEGLAAGLLVALVAAMGFVVRVWLQKRKSEGTSEAGIIKVKKPIR